MKNLKLVIFWIGWAIFTAISLSITAQGMRDSMEWYVIHYVWIWICFLIAFIYAVSKDKEK